jgi:hypothetical protein
MHRFIDPSVTQNFLASKPIAAEPIRPQLGMMRRALILCVGMIGLVTMAPEVEGPHRASRVIQYSTESSVEQSEVERFHHHTGRPWWDLLLGLSAISISLVSIFLAIQSGRAMERLVQANSWPFVMITYSTSNLDGTPHNHLDIANKGVGPASIESLEVSYAGKPVKSPRALLNAMLGRTTTAPIPRIMQSSVVHSVLSAKEQITIVDFVRDDFSVEDYAVVKAGMEKIVVQVCYCSVFDECWLGDTSKSHPAKVHSCPVPAVPFD